MVKLGLRRRGRRGFSFICMLMALAIIGVLTTNYLGTETPGAKPWAVQQQDRARAAVTAVNARMAQTQYFMDTEGRRPEIAQLRVMMDSYSQRMGGGGGGRYFVDQREQVQVTTMLQTPLFREKAELPAAR